MIFEQLKSIAEQLFRDCFEVLSHKGRSYSTRQDELQNFKDLGYLLQLDPKYVCMIYLMKHIYSISSMVRGEKLDTEGIYGRVLDAINYLILLYALFEEEKKNEENKCQNT